MIDPKNFKNVIGSNHPPFRPEVNFGFERDYKTYGYSSSVDYTTYDTASYHDYAFEAATKTPRVPQMGVTAGGHKRTLSNISSSSNVNPGFRLENDEIDSIYNLNQLNISSNTGINRMRDYENVPNYFTPTRQITKPNEYNSRSSSIERPISLGFEQGAHTKLRSSLKKYNTQQQQQRSGSSGGGTPTNPTPPDSLTSDDSSYLSAREGSISSQSRVRFSPEILLDLPTQGQHLDMTIPLQATRRLARRHTGNDPNS